MATALLTRARAVLRLENNIVGFEWLMTGLSASVWCDEVPYIVLPLSRTTSNAILGTPILAFQAQLNNRLDMSTVKYLTRIARVSISGS